MFIILIHTRIIGHIIWILYETSTNFVCKHKKHRIDNWHLRCENIFFYIRTGSVFCTWFIAFERKFIKSYFTCQVVFFCVMSSFHLMGHFKFKTFIIETIRLKTKTMSWYARCDDNGFLFKKNTHIYTYMYNIF